MALSKGTLKSRIANEMKAQGASTTGQHSWVNKMAEAIANAVVDEITTNAEVIVNEPTDDPDNPEAPTEPTYTVK